MGCTGCKNKKGFDLVMFKAKSFEAKTGKEAAVFVVNKITPSFTVLSNIDKVENICCYFTTDGVEHELTSKKVTEKKIVVEKTKKNTDSKTTE